MVSKGEVTLLGMILLLSLLTTEAQLDDQVASQENVPLVTIPQGYVRGICETTTTGKPFFSYMGIPYAEPPVGMRRFQDPVPAGKWEGVLDATHLPPACIQYDFFDIALNPVPTLIGKEDCLYLNVYTRKPNQPQAKLPVMVFIHGGAFFGGYSEQYRPYALLNEEILLVVLQYRLGILGFLSTEDDVLPGNYGLKDQTMALKWVQRNIAMFGGDPDRVTIFGQSAGGASVSYHLLSPHSDGLFAGGIAQSGNALCPWAMGSSHRRVAESLGKSFDCPLDGGTEAYLSCMRNIDAAILTERMPDVMLWSVFPFLLGPRVDNDFLPLQPEQILKKALHKDVDLMAGFARDDGSVNTYFIYGNETLLNAFRTKYPEVASVMLELREWDHDRFNQTIRIMNHYVGGAKAEDEDADKMTKMFTDHYQRVCHDLLISMHQKNSGPTRKTFYYEFDHRGQMSLGDPFNISFGKNWVTHGDDLLYLFYGGNVLDRPLKSQEDLQMRNILLKLWYNFAATGNPTPDDSLGFKWEPVTSDTPSHLAISLNSKMQPFMHQQEHEFWASIPTKLSLQLYPERFTNLAVPSP